MDYNMVERLIRRLIGQQALRFAQRREVLDAGKTFKAAQGVKQPGVLIS
jgi:hypothetical protein